MTLEDLIDFLLDEAQQQPRQEITITRAVLLAYELGLEAGRKLVLLAYELGMEAGRKEAHGEREDIANVE